MWEEVLHIVSTRRGEVRRVGQQRALTPEGRALLAELKAQPCTDCGLCYPKEVMEFDHVPGRGGKLHDVSRLKTVRAILAEAEKCDLVCANCHRLRTIKRKNEKQNAVRARLREIAAIGR